MGLIESAEYAGSPETVKRDFAVSRLERLPLDQQALDAMWAVVDAAEEVAVVAGAKAFAESVRRGVFAMLEDDARPPDLSRAAVERVEVPVLARPVTVTPSASGSSLVERLELQTSRIEMAHQARDALVAEARSERIPWEHIAHATGLTVAGARKRWGRRPGSA